MENYSITINRLSSMIGCAVKYKVKVDDVQVGEIANGKSLQLSVSQGEHKIEIGPWKKTTIIYINAIKDINLTTKVKKSTGGVDILTDDASIIVNKSSHQGNETNKNIDFQKKKTITCKTCGAEISPRAKRCPHCGEMTPGEVIGQTAIGCITAPFIFILILIAIGFYIGFIGGFLK